MKNIVFAIFGDGEFISWTYGLFTQLVKYPKVYTESDKQIETVVGNFRSKIRRLKEVSNLAKPGLEGLSIIDTQQNSEKDLLSKYSKFELAMYYLPEDEKLEEIDLTKPEKTFLYE